MRQEDADETVGSAKAAGPGLGTGARMRAVVPVLVFVAAVFALIGPSLTGSRVVLPHDLITQRLPWSEVVDGADPVNVELRDVVDQYYPVQRELLSRWRSGEDASWLEGLSLGLPGSSFIGYGALSPFNLPAVALPFDLAWSWAMGLRLFAAMAGTFLLVRSFGAGRPAATAAGLAFGLSGFMIGWLGWPQTHVGAFVPWVLWATRHAVGSGARAPWWGVPALALATGGLWLGGFPAVAAYGLVAAAAVAGHRVWAARHGGLPVVWRGLARAAAGVVAGTALAAFTLLPSIALLEQMNLDFRERAWATTIPVRGLLTFLVPRFFGDVVHHPLWLGASYVEVIGYAGVVTLALGMVGWLLVPRRPGLGLFTGLGVLTLMTVYALPPTRALLSLTPMLRENSPTRAVVLAGLAIAVTGGLGLDALGRRLRGQVRFDRRAVIVLGVAGALAVGATVVVLPTWDIAALAPSAQAAAVAKRQTLRAVLLLAGAAGVVAAGFVIARRWRDVAGAVLAAGMVGLIALDLLTFAGGHNVQVPRDTLFPDAPGISELVEQSRTHRVAGADEVGHPNTHLVYGFDDVRAHGFLTHRQTEILGRLGARRMSPTSWDLRAVDSGRWQPWLSLLGVTQVLMPRDVEQLGTLLVQPEQHVPLGPLLQGLFLHADLTAPRAGTVRGVAVRVGTYQRDNAGELVAELETPAGRQVARRSVDTLEDLGWAVLSMPGLQVSEGDPLALEITATASDPAQGVALFGRAPSPERPAAPAVALVYESQALRPRPITERMAVVDVDAPPRVAAMSQVSVVEGDQVLDMVAGQPADERTERVIVEPLDGQALPDLPDGGHAQVMRVDREGGRLGATVTSERGAVLVVRDLGLDGWEATIDGERAPVLTADYVFLGVAVPAGTHDVELRYRPPGQRAGVAISLAAAAGLVAAAGISRRRARSSSRPHPPADQEGAARPERRPSRA